MASHTPDLRFGPGTSGGFTPAGIAAFDDLRPAAVVRELIQNALDAARKANVTPATVRFRLTSTHLDTIPGIRSYKSAFRKAITTQKRMAGGPLASQAELVVSRIHKALKRKKLDVLSVLDNGVGLNEQRMNALLSDGVSIKEGDATGTYGNGHSTVIPASDLRYVLYGGLTKGGKRIGAGHAVLASHIEEGKKHPRAGDGFYILDFQAGQDTLYDYAADEVLPKLIAQTLDWIEADTTCGAAVIIPAFNNFLENESLWDMVSHAASANFFVAIEKGELVVKVEDHRSEPHVKPHMLDSSTLLKVLDAHQHKRKARAFLNGARAFEAHEAYRLGERHLIRTKEGAIEIRLLRKPAGITRIDLCRNGMWTTDRIPMLHGKFADQIPFHAVLSLNAREGRTLHNFIRIAEGPLHDALAIKRLSLSDRKKCRSALTKIANWILDNTPAVKSDSYMSDEYLTLDFGDEDGKGGGKSRSAFWGRPVPVSRNPNRQPHLFPIMTELEGQEPTGTGKGKGDSPPNRNRHRRRPALPTFFQAASCPAGRKRRRILIECERNCFDAELRLVVDEALDATCERPGQDTYTPAALSNITINGTPASDENLIRWDNKIIGVRLGDLVGRASVEVETNYQLAGDFSDLPNPSLRVEIFKTEQDSGTDNEERAGPKGES